MFDLLNKTSKKLLKNNILNKTYSHAYLFYGLEDDKLNDIVTEFVKGIFCKNDELFCDECIECMNVNNNDNPNVEHIKPKKNIKSISIEQIRNISYDSVLTPDNDDFKIYIIHESNNMTLQAQNAFLKTLEEPASNIIFILLAKESTSLLETILSRCTMIAAVEKEVNFEESAYILDMLEEVYLKRKVDTLKIDTFFCKDKKRLAIYYTFVLQFLCDVLMYKNTTKYFIKRMENFSKHYVDSIKKVSTRVSSFSQSRIIDKAVYIYSAIKQNTNTKLALINLFIYIQEEIYG